MKIRQYLMKLLGVQNSVPNFMGHPVFPSYTHA